MSKTPDELEEFLASLPGWMRRTFLTGFSSLSQVEMNEWFKNGDAVHKLTQEYERILQKFPTKWREYRSRLKREAMQVAQLQAQFLVPKGKRGRPPDPKAEQYYEQYSGNASYADIAKQELQSEPAGEAKKLLIKKESERIRGSVRRSRSRQEGSSPRT